MSKPNRPDLRLVTVLVVLLALLWNARSQAVVAPGQAVIDPLGPPYNAQGDGSTDDTAALNAAAAAVPAEGGTLLLRGRTFLVNGIGHSRAVLLHANTTLRCENATIAAGGPDANNINLISNVNGLRQLGPGKPKPVVLDQNIKVQDCAFTFPHWQVGATGNAVQMLFVRHVTFTGNTCTAGAACFSSLGSIDVHEEGNRALGVTNAAFDHYAGGSALQIVNNYAEVAANSTINSFGVQVTGSDGTRPTPISGVVISGNVIKKAGDNGAPIGLDGGDAQPISNVVITNNRVSVVPGADAPGIVDDTGGSNILIANNVIEGTLKQPAIRVRSDGVARNVTVRDNQLIHCGYQAPYTANIVLGSIGNSVTGNHAYGCSGTLYSVAGRHNTIRENAKVAGAAPLMAR